MQTPPGETSSAVIARVLGIDEDSVPGSDASTPPLGGRPMCPRCKCRASAHTCSPQSSKERQGRSYQSESQGWSARWSMATVYPSGKVELCPAVRSVPEQAERGIGTGQGQAPKMARSTIRNSKGFAERYSERGRQVHRGEFGGPGSHAVGPARVCRAQLGDGGDRRRGPVHDAGAGSKSDWISSHGALPEYWRTPTTKSAKNRWPRAKRAVRNKGLKESFSFAPFQGPAAWKNKSFGTWRSTTSLNYSLVYEEDFWSGALFDIIEATTWQWPNSLCGRAVSGPCRVNASSDYDDVMNLATLISLCAFFFLGLLCGFCAVFRAALALRKALAGSRQPSFVVAGACRHPVRGRWKKAPPFFKAITFICMIAAADANHCCRPHVADKLDQGLTKDVGPGRNCSIGDPVVDPFDLVQFPEVDLPPPEPPGVVFMNFDIADDQADAHVRLQELGAFIDENRETNLVMFGFDGHPQGRRDAPLRSFRPDDIRNAVRQAWSDFVFANFELSSVRPVPANLQGQGWITVLELKIAGQRQLPGVLVLKEIHTYRRSPAFLEDLQIFEAYRFSGSGHVSRFIAEAGLNERCEPRRHGQCTLIRGGTVLPIGFPHRLVHGDHLCFLIDEAHPEPTERIAFARPQQLVPSIQRALVGAGRRQYLTISLHGFRNGNIGIRSYGAHRERIEDPDIFAGDIMSVWHEQDFSGVLVHAAFPHYGDRDSDGAINFHFIVLFEPAANHVVLLQRRNGGPDDFVIVETDTAASLRTLSSMSPWTFVMPRGLLGERPLQQADLIEVENGMHFILYETMPAPDTGGTSLLQVHAKVLSPWYEEDLGHGRTVGRNGQRTLRPPGNGHGKRVSFKEETFFVTSDNEHSAHKKTDNPFLIDLADDLRQDVTDDHYNCFITNLRLEASFDKNPMLENDFLDSLATIHGQFGFCNDFVSGFLTRGRRILATMMSRSLRRYLFAL